MPHPLFPHPDGLPPEQDERKFVRINITRDGKYHPDDFSPEEIVSTSFLNRWGAGRYQLVARDVDGTITARSPFYEIEDDKRVPFFSSKTGPATAPTTMANATPAAAPASPHILPIVTALVGVLGPLVVEQMRGNREESQRRWEAEREDRRRYEEERRRGEERQAQKDREFQLMMAQNSQNQLAIQAQFAEKLSSVQTAAAVGGVGGEAGMSQFFQGVDFAKGMLEGQGIQQFLPMIPALISAVKSPGGAGPRPPGGGAPAPGSWANVPPNPFATNGAPPAGVPRPS